jgi:hypothetical protein
MTKGNPMPPSGGADVWLPSAAELDRLSRSPRPDWAWAFLRRDRRYRAEADQYRPHWLTTHGAVDAPVVYRSTARILAAEEWGLCTFR